MAYQPGEESLQHDLVPKRSVDIDLSGDYDIVVTGGLAPYARRLFVGTGGNVIAKKLGDAAWHTYKNVASGSYLDGAWIAVRSTGNGTTAADVIAEQ